MRRACWVSGRVEIYRAADWRCSAVSPSDRLWQEKSCDKTSDFSCYIFRLFSFSNGIGKFVFLLRDGPLLIYFVRLGRAAAGRAMLCRLVLQWKQEQRNGFRFETRSHHNLVKNYPPLDISSSINSFGWFSPKGKISRNSSRRFRFFYPSRWFSHKTFSCTGKEKKKL